MKLKTVYLVMAVLGAAVPMSFFVAFGAENGISLTSFIAALFANSAAGGFTADLLITSLVFWIYLWSQRGKGPKAWPFIVINLGIGLSCAFPAYLWAAMNNHSDGVVR